MSAFDRLNLRGLPGVQQAPSRDQRQTSAAFSYKWKRRDTYESPTIRRRAREWLLQRYCADDPDRLAAWLNEGGARKLILDAGCGSGYSALLFFGDLLHQHDYLGVDISDAVEVAASRFAEQGYPADFLQRSLDDLDFISDGSFDMIFSEGVLHHTDSTERSLVYLARKLREGGRFLFYVYRRKGPISEFTDDHIREAIRGLSEEEAWEALKPLTRLGKALGELGVTLDVPDHIPYLGIRKGKIDLQRFFYWHVCKAYHHEEYTEDQLNHINFDWYRPRNCHRHSPDEVRSFCAEAGLRIEQMNVQEAGITVVAVKTDEVPDGADK